MNRLFLLIFLMLCLTGGDCEENHSRITHHSNAPAAPVPEPTSILMFAAGLTVLAIATRK